MIKLTTPSLSLQVTTNPGRTPEREATVLQDKMSSRQGTNPSWSQHYQTAKIPEHPHSCTAVYRHC